MFPFNSLSSADITKTVFGSNQRQVLCSTEWNFYKIFSSLSRRRKMKKLFVITILAAILSACGSVTPLPAQPTQDVNAIYTFAAQTNEAQIPTSVPTSSPIPAAVAPTLIQPTSQPVATVVSGCKDFAQYVTDDGKDGTVYEPNTPFTKMWRIKNTGTCTWDSSYVVAYISGATMTQSPWYMLVPAGSIVAPGNTVDVSLGMMAPPQPGDYTANWRIQTSTGTPLVKFYLQLKVKGAVVSGDIANVTTRIDHEQGSGDPCNPNASYFVTVNITSNGSTTANYRVDLTDGSGQVTNGNFSFVDFSSPEAKGTFLFDGAMTQQLVLRAIGPFQYPDQVTVKTYINDQAWSTVTAACQ